jgi:preprotein translocase subunit SecD
MRPVRIKILFSGILMAVSILAFLWRVLFPDVFTSLAKEGIAYFLLIISLVPIVAVIGWYGATLTFPLEME